MNVLPSSRAAARLAGLLLGASIATSMAAGLKRDDALSTGGASAWAVGVYAGPMETPFDGHLHTSGFTADDHVQLGAYAASVAGDVRYWLTQSEFHHVRPFAWAMHVRYFGTDIERRSLDMHAAVAGNDSGLGIRETHSSALGFGGSWNFHRQLSAELMLGAHATRVQARAFSAEIPGSEVRFDGARTMFGPMWSLGLTQPVATLSSGRPVIGVMRWTGMLLYGMNFSGHSNTADYLVRIDRGWNHVIQIGLML